PEPGHLRRAGLSQKLAGTGFRASISSPIPIPPAKLQTAQTANSHERALFARCKDRRMRRFLVPKAAEGAKLDGTGFDECGKTCLKRGYGSEKASDLRKASADRLQLQLGLSSWRAPSLQSRRGSGLRARGPSLLSGRRRRSGR
ncbi:hypothetical protein THAOC_32935, partial [Thalassiosira oceanica]